MSGSFVREAVDEMDDPGAVKRIATAKERLARMKEIENLDIGVIKIDIEILLEIGMGRLVIDDKDFYISNRILGEVIELIYKIKTNYSHHTDQDVARFAIDQLIRRITTEA